MIRRFAELNFSPSIDQIISGSQSKRVILTGANNTGKSAYLKSTSLDRSHLYVGVNRFFSFHSLAFFDANASSQEQKQWLESLVQTLYGNNFQNLENSFFNCATAITRLSDLQREVLFSTFTDMFGVKIQIERENPLSEFSSRYISVDGDSLSVTSSGTRLFLGILAALMDDRFSCVAIDEPELGLSPVLQRKLADIMLKGHKKDNLFPHNPTIIITTHSHLFLDKDNISNNWIVSRIGAELSARACRNITELHDIQFRLLGQDLSDLLLPDAVIFAEGETDTRYIETVLALKLPNFKIVYQHCGGDIAKRLTYWSQTLGDMQISPYRGRTFVVWDSVAQSGLDRACENVGLPSSARVKWSDNGIEYVYPIEILRKIYSNENLNYNDLRINDDQVSFGDRCYKKNTLCKMVCAQITDEVEIPEEFISKLIKPLQSLRHN